MTGRSGLFGFTTRQVLTVFLVALAVRGAALWELSHSDPYFWIPVVDEQTNHHQALGIAAGDVKPTTPYWKPPLYPHFVALLYAPGLEDAPDPFLVHPARTLRVKFTQALLDSVTAVLWTALGCLVAGTRVGVIAGLLYAVSFTPVYFVPQILDTTLFLHLLAWTLLNLAIAERRGGASRWLLGGLLLGLAAVTRAPALFLLPIAAALPFFRNDPGRARVAGAGLVVLGTVVAILPVTLMNWKFARDTVIISSNGGYNFYVGNRHGDDIGSDGLTPLRPGPRDWEVMALAGNAPLASERSRRMYQVAFREIRDHPGHAVKRLLRKAHALVDGFEVPNNKNFLDERRRSWVLSLLPARTGIIFAFGITGLVFLWRELRHRWLLVGFLVTQGLGIVAFFVAARYRVPLLAVLAIPAAALILALLTRAPPLPRRRTATVVLLLLLVLLNCDPLEREERYRDYVIDPLALGLAHELRGEVDDARRYYGLALELDPDYPQAENNLGLLDLGRGDADAAERRFRRATQLTEEIQQKIPEFRFAAAWNNLGEVLLARPDGVDEALECFRRAIDEDPRSASAYLNRGQILEQQGKLREAREHYQEARRCDRERALTQLLLARIHTKLKDVVTTEKWLSLAEKSELTEGEAALREQVLRDLAALKESLEAGPEGTDIPR